MSASDISLTTESASAINTSENRGAPDIGLTLSASAHPTPLKTKVHLYSQDRTMDLITDSGKDRVLIHSENVFHFFSEEELVIS